MSEDYAISTCDKCGEKFPFNQGTIAFKGEKPIYVCPKCLVEKGGDKMKCATCGKPVCTHGRHRVSGPIWVCLDCGERNLGGPAPMWCLPMYEGKVMLATDTYYTVCKECHDAAEL